MNETSQLEQAALSNTGNQTPLVSITAPLRDSPSNHLSSASSYGNLNYLFGIQDIKMLAPKAARSRRKPSDPGQIKHRRTRSGCYTCRSRRVKCDEGRPICIRCQKGSRECVYPEPTTSSKASSSRASQSVAREELESSSGEEDGEGEYEILSAIPDEDESKEEGSASERNSTFGALRRGSSQISAGPKSSGRTGSETPSLVHDKGSSPTPSTEGSIGYSAYQNIGRARPSSKFPSESSLPTSTHDLSHLPPDLQFYLVYFRDNITYLHYSHKFDPDNFMHTHFLDAALQTDALLYAVVGFSAFQRTLHNPKGKIEDFLPYYNKSVSLLLASLKRGEKHELGIMLAILQLATIEEFLGDWINLLGHQRAAFEILTELYTPQTIMATPMTRIIISWYQRFDVFAGLLGGFQTVLSREWFTYGTQFFRDQAARDPNNLAWKIELSLWEARLVAMDMSLLFARMGKRELSLEQFRIENEDLGRRIAEWKSEMDPALRDPQYLVNDFSGAPAIDPDNIVDPYAPGVVYSGPLWPMNIATLDWISIDLLHKYQTALTMGDQPSADLTMKAYMSCQLFEAIELLPESPAETILCLQASLGISCLFLPRDERHAMWGRRKLATIESHGYIYPYTFRKKMADLFRDQSCMDWWLPNNERYPAIVRSIRKFVVERTTPAKDVPTADLAEMKAIFSSLNLDDNDSQPGKGKQPVSQHAWPESKTDQASQAVGTDFDFDFGTEHGAWDNSQGTAGSANFGGRPDGEYY